MHILSGLQPVENQLEILQKNNSFLRVSPCLLVMLVFKAFSYAKKYFRYCKFPSKIDRQGSCCDENYR